MDDTEYRIPIRQAPEHERDQARVGPKARVPKTQAGQPGPQPTDENDGAPDTPPAPGKK